MLLGFTISLSVTIAVSTVNGQCNYPPRTMAPVITQECGREETLSVIKQEILEHLQQIPHGSKLF
jgi:hypothetical protein